MAICFMLVELPLTPMGVLAPCVPMRVYPVPCQQIEMSGIQAPPDLLFQVAFVNILELAIKNNRPML